MDAAAPLLGNAPLQPLAQFLAKNGCEKPAATHPTSTVDTIQYFQGIGLREDFYLSLVSWSKKYDRRAVALGPNVYSWGQQDGIDELKLERYAFGYLTCVAYSCHDYLLLCSVESFVAVYCQRRRKIIVSTVLPEAVYCAAWTDEPGTVFAGTDRGTFYCLLITDQEIAVASQVRFHRLRICGKCSKGEEGEAKRQRQNTAAAMECSRRYFCEDPTSRPRCAPVPVVPLRHSFLVLPVYHSPLF